MMKRLIATLVVATIATTLTVSAPTAARSQASTSRDLIVAFDAATYRGDLPNDETLEHWYFSRDLTLTAAYSAGTSAATFAPDRVNNLVVIPDPEFDGWPEFTTCSARLCEYFGPTRPVGDNTWRGERFTVTFGVEKIVLRLDLNFLRHPAEADEARGLVNERDEWALVIRLGGATSSPAPVEKCAVGEVRIVARALTDGRVEFALQHRQTDCTWSAPMLPDRRFFPTDAPLGRWLVSTPLNLSTLGAR